MVLIMDSSGFINALTKIVRAFEILKYIGEQGDEDGK